MSDESTRPLEPRTRGRSIEDPDRFFRRGRSILGAVVPIEVIVPGANIVHYLGGVRITPTLVLTLDTKSLDPPRSVFADKQWSISVDSVHVEHLWSVPEGATLLRVPSYDGALPELSLRQAAGNIAIVYFRFQGPQCVAFGGTHDGRRHDIPVEVGGMGAPIFDEAWSVIGLQEQAQEGAGKFVAVPVLLRTLEDSPYWDEIAEAHRLVRTVSRSAPVSETPTESLERAVRWDPDDEPSLSERERRRALQGASLAALRAARGPSPATGPEQRAIDMILAGPPFDLAKLTADELLAFATASRWFKGIVPELPAREELERTIHRRRRLAALDAIVGSRFAPRTSELEHLYEWLRQRDRPPLVVRGPGGIGKSALLAYFVKQVCPPARFVWLDFDRPDVSADEAAILRVVDEHLAWQSGDGPLIVVLDSFEMSVQTYGYAQLNPALDSLAMRFPDLGIIVGTRASVPLLKLEGQPAQEFELAGLEPHVATRWLIAEGIAPTIAAEAAAVARGVPLNLRLTRDLLARKSEGEAHKLLADLPSQLVTGYLYRRILRRLNDESLKQPVQWTMVPRQLTPELLQRILDVSADEARRLFDALRHEVTLLEGESVLTVRADLRHTLLPLLEAEDGARVRAIDAIAAQYWSEFLTDDVAAAESVYHFLRLSELSRAESLWRRGIESHLRGYTLDELPAGSRAWLQSRVAHQSMAEHVEDLLARGQLTEARAVLADQPRALKSTSRGTRWRKLLGFLSEEERTPDVDRNLESFEAVIIHEKRPVIRIHGGRFGDAGLAWEFLETERVRGLLARAIEAVGQLRLVDTDRPSGTAVLVGPRLFMTTRSAVASCVVGIGLRARMIAGKRVTIDLRAEGDRIRRAYEVERCVLVHPYWDIALLEIAEPGDGTPEPLVLATTEPEQASVIVAIGHPGDTSADLAHLRAAIYDNVVDVKRLMPGKYMGREPELSFGREVLAAKDDSSTLSADPGAAVIDPRSGALLGIRFSTKYLAGNWSVPAWELARDPELAKAGVRLGGTPAPAPDWVKAWSTVPTPRQQLLDAYVAWRQGDIPRAQTILELLPPNNVIAWGDGVDKVLLEAACFVESDRGRAGWILDQLMAQRLPIALIDVNAIVATRLRLAVDVEAELTVLRSGNPSIMYRLLAPTHFRVIAPPWTGSADLLSNKRKAERRDALRSLGLMEHVVKAVEVILGAEDECRRLAPMVAEHSQNLLRAIFEAPTALEGRALAGALVAFPPGSARRESSYLLEKLELAPHPKHGWTPILEPLWKLLELSKNRVPEFSSEDSLMPWLEKNASTGRLGTYLTRIIQVDTPVAWVAGLLHLLTPLPIEMVLERHFTVDTH
jgi:hypothetical protein